MPSTSEEQFTLLQHASGSPVYLAGGVSSSNRYAKALLDELSKLAENDEHVAACAFVTSGPYFLLLTDGRGYIGLTGNFMPDMETVEKVKAMYDAAVKRFNDTEAVFDLTVMDVVRTSEAHTQEGNFREAMYDALSAVVRLMAVKFQLAYDIKKLAAAKLAESA